MANEITVSMSLKFTKGVKTESFSSSAQTFDMAGTDYVKGTQILTTTPGAAIDKGNIGTPGWFFAKNNSTTTAEIITITRVTGEGAVVKLENGEACCLRLGATAPFAFSATGAPELEYLIIED
jgi:hypothetical protein